MQSIDAHMMMKFILYIKGDTLSSLISLMRSTVF